MSIKVLGKDYFSCSHYKKNVFVLEWRPEKMLSAGTEVSLRLGTKKQFLSLDVIKSYAEGIDPIYRMEVLTNPMGRWEEHNKEVYRGKLNYLSTAESVYRFHLTVKQASAIAGEEYLFSVWIKDQSANVEEIHEYVKEENSETAIIAKADCAEYFYVIPRPTLEEDGRLRVSLVAEDRFGNPTEFEQEIPVILSLEQYTYTAIVKAPTLIYIECDKMNFDQNKILRLSAAIKITDLDSKENILNGKVNDQEEIEIMSSPIWLNYDGGIPAFGEIHWHTEESGDGIRLLKEAIEYGRDVQNMDFIAPANHYSENDDGKSTIDMMDKYNEDGKFATFYGWEMASDRGHVNFYFIDRNSRFRPGGKYDLIDEKMKSRPGGDVNLNKRPNDYMDELEGDDFILIPHHTNASGIKNSWTPFPWETGKNAIRLCEIMQGRGNQEFDEGSNKWRSFFDSNGSSVRHGLEKGYKFGFTGGTDNHSGWPSRISNDSDTTVGVKGVIMTGVWTQKRNRNEVYKALHDRRTWAVWGTRAIVDFKVNGHHCGSEITVDGNNGLEVFVKVSGEDSLWSMEIISNGGQVMWRDRTSKMDYENVIKLDIDKNRKNQYFYFRAMQKNGALIYASPVFIDYI